MPFLSIRTWRLGFLAAAAALWAQATTQAQTPPKGQRVFFSGHSFHYFMPPILADMAKRADIKDHVQVGLSAIGGMK